MKFCGYQNRNAIVKLKDRDEVQKMLKYVSENEELFEDEAERADVFGRFKNKPHLLSIPPGLEVDFKNLIQAVENMVKPAGKSKHSPTSSSATRVEEEAAQKSKKEKPTAEQLTERAKKVLLKDAGKAGVHLSAEVVTNAFTIKSSGHSFKFTCNKIGCKQQSTLPYSDRTKDVTMSNLYRHLKSCLFGVKRSGKEKADKPILNSISFTKPSPSFFGKKGQAYASTSTNREFVPQNPDDRDFSIHDDLMGTEPDVTASKTETTSSVTTTTDPKNLKLPAGHPERDDVSGL